MLQSIFSSFVVAALWNWPSISTWISSRMVQPRGQPLQDWATPIWKAPFYTPFLLSHLVGGFNPSEKYESPLGWLFPVYGKITNVPNPQPAIVFISPFCSVKRCEMHLYYHHSDIIELCWPWSTSTSPIIQWDIPRIIIQRRSQFSTTALW